MHRDFCYAIVRRDHRTPGYGYIASNHTSLALAYKALQKAHDDHRHAVYWTGGWRPRGSIIALHAWHLRAVKEAH